MSDIRLRRFNKSFIERFYPGLTTQPYYLKQLEKHSIWEFIGTVCTWGCPDKEFKTSRGLLIHLGKEHKND